MRRALVLILSANYAYAQSGDESGSGSGSGDFEDGGLSHNDTASLIQTIRGIDPTLTGFSGGGEMSCMMHTIHSATFVGAASIGGSSYASPMINSDYGKKNINKNLRLARRFSKAGKIDNLANLTNSRVYVLHGKNDKVVPVYLGQKNQEILQKNQQISQSQTRHQAKIWTQFPNQKWRTNQNFELSLQEKSLHEPKRKP